MEGFTLTSKTKMKVKTTDMVAKGTVTEPVPFHCNTYKYNTSQVLKYNVNNVYCMYSKPLLTLTDRRTDWANTSTAIPRLKKGCWVMSYILARKPAFSA